VPGNGVFHDFYGHIRLVAAALLLATAQEAEGDMLTYLRYASAAKRYSSVQDLWLEALASTLNRSKASGISPLSPIIRPTNSPPLSGDS
jgi:hypothetical protein